MSHGHGSKNTRASKTALIAGSGAAGLMEIAIFHPIDTIAKRLMSNQNRVVLSSSATATAIANSKMTSPPHVNSGFPSASTLTAPKNPLAGTTPVASLSSIIFPEAVVRKEGVGTASLYFSRWMSLFPGIGFATSYKVMQRCYKFGGQPVVQQRLQSHSNGIGTDRLSKPMSQALAGSIIGIGEIILLPLDVLKIKRQTNPEALRGRSLWDIIKKENVALYRGGCWTAARNAPGSFALFGGAAFAKEYMFKLKNYSDATVTQNFACNTFGAIASIVVSNPLDVIKTRIQNKNFDKPVSGTTVLQNLVRDEGITAFWKGLVPKTAAVAPKLIFAMTAAQWLTVKIDGALGNIPATATAIKS